MSATETLFRTVHGVAHLPEVCRRFHVRQLDLFGSAAIGEGFDPTRGDLDLIVTFEPMKPVKYAEAWFGLREALEALSGRPVEFSTDSAIENPLTAAAYPGRTASIVSHSFKQSQEYRAPGVSIAHLTQGGRTP